MEIGSTARVTTDQHLSQKDNFFMPIASLENKPPFCWMRNRIADKPCSQRPGPRPCTGRVLALHPSVTDSDRFSRGRSTQTDYPPGGNEASLEAIFGLNCSRSTGSICFVWHLLSALILNPAAAEGLRPTSQGLSFAPELSQRRRLPSCPAFGFFKRLK